MLSRMYMVLGNGNSKVKEKEKKKTGYNGVNNFINNLRLGWKSIAKKQTEVEEQASIEGKIPEVKGMSPEIGEKVADNNSGKELISEDDVTMKEDDSECNTSLDSGHCSEGSLDGDINQTTQAKKVSFSENKEASCSSVSGKESLNFKSGKTDHGILKTKLVSKDISQGSDQATLPTVPVPIIKLSPTDDSIGPSVAKKKVKIQEPNKRNLPSKRHRFGPNLQVEKVKLLPSSPPQSPSRTSAVGSVSAQWSQMCQTAIKQVHLTVPHCDSFTSSLIFNNNMNKVKQSLDGLNHTQICDVMFNIKKILYAEWFIQGSTGKLYPIPLFDMIIFSIQRFIILVSLRVKDFPSQRIHKYYERFTDLQTKCQKYRFSDPVYCLKETQLLYVAFYVSLLEIF